MCFNKAPAFRPRSAPRLGAFSSLVYALPAIRVVLWVTGQRDFQFPVGLSTGRYGHDDTLASHTASTSSAIEWEPEYQRATFRDVTVLRWQYHCKSLSSLHRHEAINSIGTLEAGMNPHGDSGMFIAVSGNPRIWKDCSSQISFGTSPSRASEMEAHHCTFWWLLLHWLEECLWWSEGYY